MEEEEDRDEMEDEPEMRRGTVACVAAALVAAGVGVLVGFLMAPASGRETRRVVRRRAEEEAAVVERKVRRAAEDVGHQAKRLVKDKLDKGKRALSKLSETDT